MRRMWNRELGWGMALLAGIGFNCLVTLAQEKRPTAREVVAAIQEHVGVPWNVQRSHRHQ
jgi:hypothetical protein